jgi:integrase
MHDLRHSAGTLALLANKHPLVVNQMLGHADVSMTLGEYSHVQPSMQDDLANTVNRMLFGYHA